MGRHAPLKKNDVISRHVTLSPHFVDVKGNSLKRLPGSGMKKITARLSNDNRRGYGGRGS